MKLLFDRNTLRPLGVHAIGESATEIIHVDQAVIAFEGTIDYLCDASFNYPTFAEAYKVAALNGLNRLQAKAPTTSRYSRSLRRSWC